MTASTQGESSDKDLGEEKQAAAKALEYSSYSAVRAVSSGNSFSSAASFGYCAGRLSAEENRL